MIPPSSPSPCRLLMCILSQSWIILDVPTGTYLKVPIVTVQGSEHWVLLCLVFLPKFFMVCCLFAGC
jgi:hypothetical protein